MKNLLLLVVVSVLTGCSSFKYSQGMEYKAPVLSGPSPGAEVQYPSWYASSNDNSDNLYGVASEFSKDFQHAVDKTMLSAKRELASHYSSYVSSMMKDFASEVGNDGNINREVERTTKLVVAQVNLVGVRREKFEVRHEGSGYRAFVKLSYNTSEANKIMVEQIKRNKQLAAQARKSEAFREMEDSVNSINGTTRSSALPQSQTLSKGEEIVILKETIR